LACRQSYSSSSQSTALRSAAASNLNDRGNSPSISTSAGSLAEMNSSSLSARERAAAAVHFLDAYNGRLWSLESSQPRATQQSVGVSISRDFRDLLVFVGRLVVQGANRAQQPEPGMNRLQYLPKGCRGCAESGPFRSRRNWIGSWDDSNAMGDDLHEEEQRRRDRSRSPQAIGISQRGCSRCTLALKTMGAQNEGRIIRHLISRREDHHARH
jgi:hypothetical protein